MPHKPEDPEAAPGERLRRALAAAGITQRELARRMGITPARISDVIAGRGPSSLEWLHAAATAAGVDPHDVDERLASTKGGP